MTRPDPIDAYLAHAEFHARENPTGIGAAVVPLHVDRKGGERLSCEDGALFAVHQDSARTQHYDLRLEICGVLVFSALERGHLVVVLVKKRDAEADGSNQPMTGRPESVLSGRTIEQLAAETGWPSTHR